MPPFRQQAGAGEDLPEWQPPSYAQPLDEEESGGEWKPPSYAQLVKEEPPKKPSVFSRVKEAVLHPKPYNPATGKPTEIPEKKPLPNLSSEERIRAANELQDPGQGDYFARHPEKPPEKNVVDRFLEGVTSVPKSIYETVNTIGKRGAEQLRRGDIHGAFETATSPLMGPIETINQRLLEGKKPTELGQSDAQDEAVSQVLGIAGLPGKEAIEAYRQGDYAKLAGMGLTAAVVAGAFHKVGELGNRPELPIRQTGIPNRFRSEEVGYRAGEPTNLENFGPPVREAVASYIKRNPEAKMADIESFVKSVKPEKSNLPAEFSTQEDVLPETGQPPISRGKSAEELSYEIARDKFNMGRELPTEEQVNKTFVNPFEKKPTEWKPPEYAQPVTPRISEEELTKGFGGSGHPESDDYTAKVLSKAGTGKPGLSVEPLTGDNVADIGTQHVVYRGEDGNPVAVAKIVRGISGKNMVMDLALDKTKGLLGGRAMQNVGNKLVELGATESAGTMSPDAENFLKRMKSYLAKKNKESGWKPPDYAKAVEEPSLARTESGGTRIDIGDVKDMIKVFRNTYSGSVPHIATKELVQNAIDATANLGENAMVNVKTNAKNGTITVEDNGPGLTRDMIDTVYSNLSGSGKRGGAEKTVGELGVGKTTYMVAGKHVAVDTVARDADGKLYRHTFEGTPDEVMEEFHPVKTEVPEGTPTGTKVTMQAPEGAKFDDLETYLDHFHQYSNNPVPVHIEHTGPYSFSKMQAKDVPARTSVGGRNIGGENLPEAKYNLTIPDDAKWIETDRIPLIINNRGMFQGVDQHYVGGKMELPDRIVVDLDPNVPGTDEKYPLTAPTRERFKHDTRHKIGQYIDKNLVDDIAKKRSDELTRVYNKLEQSKDKHVVYDGGERYTPQELKNVKQSKIMRGIGDIVKQVTDELASVIDIGNKKITRTGFIFDQVRGVNLKLPGSDNLMLMVNPFAEMTEVNTPKQAAQGIVHIIMHEFTHVNERTEGANYTAHLATVYEKFDLERQIDARNKILDLLTVQEGFNPFNRRYSPEITKLLQEYQDSRGRPATSNDLLLREAGSSYARQEKPGNIPSGNRPDGEGVVRQAVSKLIDALGNAKEGMQEQETINKKERARRFAAFSGVKEEGAAGAAKSLGKLRGEFEKVEPGKDIGLNEKETDALFTAIKQAKITTGEQARGYTALFKLLNGESVPQRNELQILDSVFGNGFGDKIIEMHGGIGGVGIKLSKAANTMKSMQNSISLAAPLRHGIGLIARKEFYPAFRDMFRFFGNKEFFDNSMKAIEDHPDFIKYREAGGFFAKSGSLLNSEEEFLNSYVGSLPRFTGIPQIVGASNRAYTGFLNKLRFDTNRSMWKKAESLGTKMFENVDGEMVPTKEAKAIAKFVNNATGRGDLGSLNKMTNELNLLLWSPRMIASRVNMLANPKIYMDLPRGMRREGLKSLLGIAALGTVIDTLAAYGGAKVSTNILSTDYGKARFGTKLIDPWGGLQQYIVGAARFLAGKTDIPRPTSRLEIAGRFLANKESPAASLAHMILTSKPTKGGEPGDITTEYGQKTSVEREIVNRFTPIFVQDLEQLVESEPDWSEDIGLTAAMAGASIAGMAQEYPEKKTGGLGFRKPKITVR